MSNKTFSFELFFPEKAKNRRIFMITVGDFDEVDLQFNNLKTEVISTKRRQTSFKVG